MMSRKTDRALKETPNMCHLAERGGKRTREGATSGVGRLERMKRGNGIKGRDDRSSGIEIVFCFIVDR
jgi:hypothetical protein